MPLVFMMTAKSAIQEASIAGNDYGVLAAIIGRRRTYRGLRECELSQP
jgi:hypothetical protein